MKVKHASTIGSKKSFYFWSNKLLKPKLSNQLLNRLRRSSSSSRKTKSSKLPTKLPKLPKRLPRQLRRLPRV